MFEEGSFRRRPRGFRRKALKPYPGPGLYQSPVPSHVPDPTCPPGPVRHPGGPGGHYEAASPAVTSSAPEFSHVSHPGPAHAPVDPLLPTSVSHHSFVPFNNNHVSSSVLSGNLLQASTMKWKKTIVTSGYYNYPVLPSDYSPMAGLPPMEPPTYSPRPTMEPGYSPAPRPGPDMVDLAPAAPWPCWSSEYQPPPPPAFASPVEAELALSGQSDKYSINLSMFRKSTHKIKQVTKLSNRSWNLATPKMVTTS